MEVTSLNPLVDMVLKVTMGKFRDMVLKVTMGKFRDMEQEQATDLNLKFMEEEEATRLHLQDMEEEEATDRLHLQDMEEEEATDRLLLMHMEETSKQVDTVVPQATVDQVTVVPQPHVIIVPQGTMVDQQATPPNKIMAEAPTVALQATRNKDTVKVKDMEEEARDTEVGAVGQKKRK
jgi:hypothetical protein